ncbi:MAG: peptidylprolyl isomerase [Pseudonocardiaceae bacterium]
MPTNEQRRQAAKRKLDRQLARRAQRAKRRRLYAVVGSAAAVVLVIGLVVLITVLGRREGADTAAAPGAEPVPSSAVASKLPEQPQTPTRLAPPLIRSAPLPASVDCQYPASPQPAAKPVAPPRTGSTFTEGSVDVTLATSAGAVPVTLDRSLAPCTVNSFTSLAQQGYYNGSPCHRLTTSPSLEVLQCGDPTGTGTGGPGYTVPDETFGDLAYGRGYLAMANTGQPNSGGGQFFIVYGSADALNANPTYTVFGTVSEQGMQVIDTIARAGNDAANGPGDGAPKKSITIQTATVAG